jgi:hypothetical protein
MSLLSTLAQYSTDYTDYNSDAGSGISAVLLLVYLVVLVVVLAANWKIFVKAGKPGWAVLIPIYNFIVFLQIVKKPWWWILLLLIPFVNIFVAIYVSYLLAKAFGYGVGMTILLLLTIGYLILGFNSSKYQPELLETQA